MILAKSEELRFKLQVWYDPRRFSSEFYSCGQGKRHLILEELSETELFYIIKPNLSLTIVRCDIIHKGWSEGNKTYGYKFGRMNGKTEAIHYHHSDVAPISVMSQLNFWHMVPKTVVNRYANHVRIYKKYLMQQNIYQRVLDKNGIGARRIVSYSHTLANSFCIRSSWKVSKATLLHPSSLDSNGFPFDPM